MENFIIWIILLPAIGALANGVLGGAFWRENKTAISVVGCGAVAVSLVITIFCVVSLAGLPADERSMEQSLGTFIPGGILPVANGETAAFAIDWKFRFDPLSAFMALVVNLVGFLIHIYSIGYMGGHKGYFRFFAYMNLFMTMMLTLVLAGNFVVMFIGWEGVGLCSYLLIGFYYKEYWVTDCANKAFIVNRIGDLFMVLAVGLIFFSFGTLDFAEVNTKAVEAFGTGAMFNLWNHFTLSPEVLCTIVGLLIFIAATAKSAQFPLYVWLPDAMAGPTPVSALIHAATMVTSGIYIIVRLNGLYQVGTGALLVVAVVGAVTALLAATIALAQNDIKKVLAYSTVSQLGYMFVALGVGAFTAGMFHLMTHAFFKALLFLSAGSVIHAMSGEQNMQKMGGLKQYLPVTHFTMLIGAIAIAGFPPLAGFFSKDEILFSALTAEHGSKIIWGIGSLVALMTAFYMFRLYYTTFHGLPRMSDSVKKHIHESPRVMTVPLILLAAGSATVGFLGIPPVFVEHFHAVSNWLEPSMYKVHNGHPHHASAAMELGLMALAVAIAAAGFLWARRWYQDGTFSSPKAFADNAKKLHTLVLNKFYIDEAYYFIFVDGFKWACRQFSNFDAWIIDGFFVNGVGGLLTKILAYLTHFFDIFIVDKLVELNSWLSHKGSAGLRRIQTGAVQNYVFVFICGILLLIVIYSYTGR